MVAPMSSRRRLWFSTVALVVLLAGHAFAKRAAPTEVPPIVDGNVRYEAPHFNNPCGQTGGCVVAYDNASNAVLWSVQVYCTHYDTSVETDVQDVFITSLAVDHGQVLVTNEKAQHFTIDPASKRIAGDATGCDGGASDGCSVLDTPSTAMGSRMVGVLGLLGLAGMFLRRPRRS
jgi:MYXO-CTERM domain-containing protein